MVKKYTLVTVETPSGWLLINRTNPPYRGMWNTLGGKFLPNETPATCASRELQEESHIIIPPHDLINGGRVFWHVDGELRAELFAFFGHTEDELVMPRATREGILATFSKDWLLADNPGLVPDLQPLLHYALNGERHDYASYFTGDRLEDFCIADGEIDD
ncbi:8-oxo-dGTP diphosphatase [Lacticaseibacillus paracasei]|jgi:8-oxo-dGTP diphosphatase|uniref:NUDIX domain protein n=2 Tax=Lacticaseibacillus paracasei TaxID=1597 RepID=A0A422LRM2_LACPA|nr:8-oxo-dGTP diphosphatase [Lacticaseibacillus paracasei]EKQ18893.1 MutT/nudix family protein [Lacticaseibacillus casei UW4]EPC32191.1 ADP-ribose pyrophosphatase [Lacticaseibacillus paracasei subsp. paracasei Lpp22]OJF74919.1 7,8-dihydro-8-oxoguanine triphosphatase [Lacticaseibacillus casei]AKU35726.1 ADP-ribose pyrophosphatase [Lacticaseibacillus paracasei]ATG99842.1 ADP-ribose pyrophosphatase [Lacticaseibacillus paracasei]